METEMAQPDGMGMRGVSRRHSNPSVVRAILSRGGRRLLGGAWSWLPRCVVVEKAQDVGGEDARPVRTVEDGVAIPAVRGIDDHLDALARRSQPLLEIAPEVDVKVSVVLRPQDEHRCVHGPSRLLPRAVHERRGGLTAKIVAPDKATCEP